ncbi:uncharacterized protein LOC109831841 [Asparagus officinalis]|uniref:uncharacterized protein LOC109831841 n=1 Tax=Asparagus officinalis TaxID=4686 RepID=UPI00098E6D54|nr:uncharacterized protein LOC109831841 [Asparagus officinalis]
MDTITHRTVEANGIRLHVAEKGEGPTVLLLHGFPELWYSWRHQVLAIFHLAGDIVALIDSLGQDKVFVVGHDWGALVAWSLCMFRPDRVKALVNLSVAFNPRNPAKKPVDYFKSIYGDDYYICKFQKPGVAEAEFGQYDIKSVHKKLLSSRDPRPFFIREGRGLGSPNDEIALPSWLSEEDINYFSSKYEKTGFAKPINYYRNLDLNWELTEPWQGCQIKVPTKFIVGDMDLTYHYPGIQDYIHKGGFKKSVPLLEEVVVMPGVSHWINQEKAHEVTEHILDFIKKF